MRWVIASSVVAAALLTAVVSLREAETLRPSALTEQIDDVAVPAPAPVLAGSQATLPDLTESAVLRPLVEYPDGTAAIDEVRWTPTKTLAWADLASQWGLPVKTLRGLNPELRRKRKAVAGTPLVVFQHDDAHPSLSVGAPNRGKLVNGIPLPEGDAWRLRERRVRTYGGTVMVESLVKAFGAYEKAFPGDEAEIRLGDLSDRNGGRLSPHVSHRTGRDVDIGYIIKDGKRGERYWQNAKEDTFDVEKNWYLIKALVETGRVQQIFMSARLQALVLPLAREELSAEQLARYFRKANPDPRSPSVIKHWRGHLDHMHVRFTCESGNRRCRSRSR